MAKGCPKCGSDSKIKAGLNNDKKQRYKCQECGCHFTRSTKKGYPPEVKRKAIQLYLEGVSYRAIGRILNVSNVTVLNWISGIRPFLTELIPQFHAEVAFIDLDDALPRNSLKASLAESGLFLRMPTKDASMSPVTFISVRSIPPVGNV